MGDDRVKMSDNAPYALALLTTVGVLACGGACDGDHAVLYSPPFSMRPIGSEKCVAESARWPNLCDGNTVSRTRVLPDYIIRDFALVKE